MAEVETKTGADLKEQLAEVMAPYKGQRGAVVPLLQKIQGKLGYLPETAIAEIANFLNLSRAEIYGVATFYTQFRFTHPGDHTVKVCLGTACHVRGGAKIMDTVERELAVHPGGVTADRKFGLERVACFGCCALAPVMVVDDRVYSKMTTTKVKDVLKVYH